MKYAAIGAFPDITERKFKESARARVLAVEGSSEAALWAARRLRAMGYEVEGPVKIEKSVEAVGEAVKAALGSCDLIVVTGGVEPSSAPAFEGIAAALGRALVENEEAKQHVEEYYLLEETGGTASGMYSLELAKALTLLPEGSTVLRNPKGPAPGILLEEDGKYLICVPGSLAETGAIFEEEADPYVRSVVGASFSTTVHVMTKTWEEEAITRVVDAVSETVPWVFVQLKRTVYTKEGWGITVTVFAKNPDELSEKLVRAVEIVEEALERENIGFDKKDLSGL